MLPSIKRVMELDLPLLPRRDKTKDSNKGDFDCPYCGKKGKFHVDYKGNVFRCNACGESGGVLQLHRTICGLSDNKAAYQDLKTKMNYDSDTVEVTTEPTENIPKPTMIELRDKVYTNLLSFLSLSTAHRADLIQRGLTEEQIKAGNYQTFPVVGFCTLAELALWKSVNIDDFQKAISYWMQLFKRNNGSNIPGFFKAGDAIRIVRRSSGYFVPVRDIFGRISGLQIRYDNLPESATDKEKVAYHKYAWFSSSEKQTGCTITGIETIHHVGFKDPDQPPEVVYLTEGALKADIASAISGRAFIALIGVNNANQLPKALSYLKEHGTKKIRVAIDMDYRSKPAVGKALDNIMRVITDAGLEKELLTWDSQYKGIDDFLLEDKKRRIQ